MKPPSFSTVATVLGLAFTFAVLSIHPVQAATYYVDDDHCPSPGSGTVSDPFCSIQTGINAATEYDSVQVAPGTYYENITMKSGVVIKGSGQGISIIDGGSNGSVVTATDVDSAARLEGFTITNGSYLRGGGMNNYNSSPTVTNCTFIGNSALYYGGGMSNDSSSPTLTNCIFSENTASFDGGGMINYSSSPTVTNCIFSENWTSDYGGGMSNEYSSPTLTNCTFSGNSTYDFGGGMYNYYSSPTLINCIIWGSSPEEIFNFSSTLSVTYSDIQGGYTGAGNINADPMFVDPANGDFHLRQGSPCIDAGDNSAIALPITDIDGNDRKIGDPRVPDTGNGPPPIVDMGPYELKPDMTAMPWLPLLLFGD